jgi:hypothetical protein
MPAPAPRATTITTKELRTTPSKESELSTTSFPKDGSDPSNPFSAFYRHPPARRSMEHDSTKSPLDVPAYDHDLEAGAPLSAATTMQHSHSHLPASHTSTNTPKISVDGRVKECTMWPTHQTMLQKKKETRRRRGCGLFRSLSSKQRLWVKIGIALFIVALAVGLGIGISKAVGGGVWAGNGKSKAIPDS